MKVADRERCAGCSRRAHVAREARSGGRRREQALTAATMPESAGVAMGAIIVKMDAGGVVPSRLYRHSRPPQPGGRTLP